jgi:hypothetical protein
MLEESSSLQVNPWHGFVATEHVYFAGTTRIEFVDPPWASTSAACPLGQARSCNRSALQDARDLETYLGISGVPRHVQDAHFVAPVLSR